MRQLGKLHSGMSYSAVGFDFNVTESTVYLDKVSLSRCTHKRRLYIDRLMKMLLPETPEIYLCISIRGSDSVFGHLQRLYRT